MTLQDIACGALIAICGVALVLLATFILGIIL